MFQTAAGHSKWPISVALSLLSTALTPSTHCQCHVHVLQRFTTNYWVLSEPHIASRHGDGGRRGKPRCPVAINVHGSWPVGRDVADVDGGLRTIADVRMPPLADSAPLLAVRPVALLMWRCNWTGKLHISSYFYAEFNGRREAGTAAAAAAARRPGQAESTEENLQLFVVSNEIIYCCLLCGVVDESTHRLPLAAEHVARWVGKDKRKRYMGQGMLYNCMRIEPNIYETIRIASHRVASNWIV